MFFLDVFSQKYKLRSVLYTENNTVQTASEKLKKKEVVCVFLKKKWRNKGIYYIAKETECPILIVKREKAKIYSITTLLIFILQL